MHRSTFGNTLPHKPFVFGLNKILLWHRLPPSETEMIIREDSSHRGQDGRVTPPILALHVVFTHLNHIISLYMQAHTDLFSKVKDSLLLCLTYIVF